MNVRTLCLAMLEMGDASGYEIKTQSVEGDWRYFVEASFGAIYPALRTLEEDGYVVSRQEGDPGRPPRKVYSITPSGRGALLAALNEMPSEDTFRSEFLMHAIFAENLSKAHLARIVDRRIAEYEGKRAGIARMMERFTKAGPHWAGDLGLTVMDVELNYLRTRRDALIELGHDDALPLQDAAE